MLVGTIVMGLGVLGKTHNYSNRKLISGNTEIEDGSSISQTPPLARMSNELPQAPEYEDIQELQAIRSANPSSSSSGGPNTAAECVQCPAVPVYLHLDLHVPIQLCSRVCCCF
jgi:hypothetical protein